MLSMAPADSVIGSFVCVMTICRPTPVGFSWGPVLTPDSIDSVFDGCHPFFHEDRPATGVHRLFASARMWSQGSMARKNETEEAFTHTGIPSGNVSDMKYCLRFKRSNRLLAVSPTSCGPPESPIMFVIEPLRLGDDPRDRAAYRPFLSCPDQTPP